MAHDPQIFKDRAVEFPRRYVTGEGEQITLARDPGEVYEEGTPMNAAAMNRMGQGIANAGEIYKSYDAPTVNDDSSVGVGVGDRWIKLSDESTAPNKIYTCVSAAPGAAAWSEMFALSTKNALPGLAAATGYSAAQNSGYWFRLGPLVFFYYPRVTIVTAFSAATRRWIITLPGNNMPRPISAFRFPAVPITSLASGSTVTTSGNAFVEYTPIDPDTIFLSTITALAANQIVAFSGWYLSEDINVPTTPFIG